MRIKAKVSRRIGEPIFGQGKRNAVLKRAYAPGKLDSERKHKSSTSEFGIQMREKQKVRFSYGIREKQFANYVKKAMALKGSSTIEGLYADLESRLDNVVYRAGFAVSRGLARQMVSHGHILVNGKKIKIASYSVRPNDVVSFRDGSKKSPLFTNFTEKIKDLKTPTWLTFDKDTMGVKVTGTPKDAERLFNLPAVIEFYSR